MPERRYSPFRQNNLNTADLRVLNQMREDLEKLIRLSGQFPIAVDWGATPVVRKMGKDPEELPGSPGQPIFQQKRVIMPQVGGGALVGREINCRLSLDGTQTISALAQAELEWTEDWDTGSGTNGYFDAVTSTTDIVIDSLDAGYSHLGGCILEGEAGRSTGLAVDVVAEIWLNSAKWIEAEGWRNAGGTTWSLAFPFFMQPAGADTISINVQNLDVSNGITIEDGYFWIARIDGAAAA